MENPNHLRVQHLLIVAYMVLALSSSFGRIPVVESFVPTSHVQENFRNNNNPCNVNNLRNSLSTMGDEAYYSPSFVQYGERTLQQQQQKVALTRFLSHEVHENPEVRELIGDCCVCVCVFFCFRHKSILSVITIPIYGIDRTHF